MPGMDTGTVWFGTGVGVQTPATDPNCRAEFIRPSANKFAPTYRGELTVMVSQMSLSEKAGIHLQVIQ